MHAAFEELCFNSTLVQLKAMPLNQLDGIYYSFNSTLVQLKVKAKTAERVH